MQIGEIPNTFILTYWKLKKTSLYSNFLSHFLPLLQLYNAKDIAFLLDPKDSVQAYEEAGKMNKQESQYEKGMKALASMGHVQKLTAIEGKIMRL